MCVCVIVLTHGGWAGTQTASQHNIFDGGGGDPTNLLCSWCRRGFEQQYILFLPEITLYGWPSVKRPISIYPSSFQRLPVIRADRPYIVRHQILPWSFALCWRLAVHKGVQIFEERCLQRPGPEASGPQGEKTRPNFYCRMPTVWPHLCVQLWAAISSTASLTSSSIRLTSMIWYQ